MKTIPKFGNEDQEREFWVTHDSTDYVDWSRAKAVSFSRLKPSTQMPEASSELTGEVEIHREGEPIVLEPVRIEEWPESFWGAFEGMPEDFERPT